VRKLFILRGAMASGKSTFINKNNLEDFTLNPDKIRLMYNSPEMTIHYNEMIPQFNNNKVWSLLLQILEDRMRKGELTFIDAMHVYAKDLSIYKKLAEKYRYRLYVIDFTDIEYDELIKRNNERDIKKWVPEESIKRIYKALQKEKISKAFTLIKPEEFNNVINMTPRNVDSYYKIHIFGDLHGNFKPLNEYFENYPIKDNELYIFTGDYFDRGFENIDVFNFIKNKLDKKNFIFLTGNHEDRLYKYACDDEYRLDYDLMKTLEELEGKISKSEIRGLVKGLSQIVNIEFKEKHYIISHGGIPYYPKKSLDFYSTNSFIYGIDKYDVDIDKIYNDFMSKQNKKVYQIHGHRNHYGIDYNKYEYSYNLDGDIENGGYLRVLTLNDDGSFNFNNYKNNNYDPKLVEKENTYSLIENLRRNKYIFEKELEDNVSSFNFSKEAFYNKVWNNITTQARGLFIDTKNYLVIARSYNKFFNLDEREETKYENLKEKLNYPAYFYLKYNGFLGILSIYNNEFVFGTKSQISGDYSDYFRNIFDKLFDKEQQNSIKKRLINNNSSMIFEVVDSVNDKHIIEYGEDRLILLDEIYNSINYSKVNYDELKAFADKNKVEIKKLVYVVNNVEEFEDRFNEIKQEDFRLNNCFVEGFVVEDSSGFMFKYKTNYYKKWKLLRSKMENAIKNNDYKTKGTDKLEIEFIKYLENKYKDKEIDINSINIIDERNEFEKLKQSED